MPACGNQSANGAPGAGAAPEADDRHERTLRQKTAMSSASAVWAARVRKVRCSGPPVCRCGKTQHREAGRVAVHRGVPASRPEPETSPNTSVVSIPVFVAQAHWLDAAGSTTQYGHP